MNSIYIFINKNLRFLSWVGLNSQVWMEVKWKYIHNFSCLWLNLVKLISLRFVLISKFMLEFNNSPKYLFRKLLAKHTWRQCSQTTYRLETTKEFPSQSWLPLLWILYYTVRLDNVNVDILISLKDDSNFFWFWWILTTTKIREKNFSQMWFSFIYIQTLTFKTLIFFISFFHFSKER